MKKILSLFVFLLVIGMVSAKVGSPDVECQANGFDFGIEKFASNDEFELEDDNSEYDITVDGDAQEADWTASPAVDGVLVKSATNTTVFAGGTSGTIYGWTEFKFNDKKNTTEEITHDISHVTFCGNNEVPEFGVVAGAVALVGALGVFLYRRKD
jgi:hypothetical protein